MKTTIAILEKSDKNVAKLAIEALKRVQGEEDNCFGVITPSEHYISKNLNSFDIQSLNSSSIVAYNFSDFFPQRQPKITKIQSASLLLEGTIYPANSEISSDEMIEMNIQTDHKKMTKSILENVEGDFFLLISKNREILAARDPIGAKPLYYGENRTIAALASNRRALLELGIENTNSFPPGCLAHIKSDGFKFEHVKRVSFTNPKKITMQKGAETLAQLIEDSLIKRIRGLKEVAVGFSGGLDSSLIAYLAKKNCQKVELIHVSIENQPETEEAQKAAKALNLPLSIYLFNKGDVENTAPKVVELIEESDPVKLGVGIPFYWLAQKTAERGFRELFAGQGADELFGGYHRYISQYIREDDEKVSATMFSDISEIHQSNLERDAKICNFHNIDLRLPFASYEIVKFAVSLPLELKIEKKESSLRKLVLRKVAENWGIPSETAQKPKKAVQYSTGVSYVLKKIAKSHKTTLSGYVQEIFQKTEKKSEQ
jgi:asparagine synthase (glutamine-hydrolysing)